MTTRVNVGLIGCGTVGQGVVKLLQSHLAVLEEKMGGELRLTWVCDRAKRPLPPGPHKPRFTTDWREVVEDPSVHIVVELVGGYEPARTMVLAALSAGKHVATANKALLAKHWEEVLVTAQETRALLYFEAAVGGGIPVVQGLSEGLAANHIERIYGILNGTTNYILSRMAQEGLDFASALKAAQAAGFAEADPTFDIEGIDAAHKIAILASLASGSWVRLEDVGREGIADLDVWDVRFAAKLGFVVKLLGLFVRQGGRFSVRVHPTLIPAAHPFATVNREYNAIFVHGDAAGDVMFYGKGAGQMAAASAVVSDVVYLSRQVVSGVAGAVPYVAIHPGRRLSTVPFEEVICRHYLRFTVKDKPGVLAKITGLLGRYRISIASVHQEEGEGMTFAGGPSAKPAARRRRGIPAVPIVIVTHKAPEGSVRAALKAAGRLPAVLGRTVHLRIEDLG